MSPRPGCTAGTTFGDGGSLRSHSPDGSRNLSLHQWLSAAAGGPPPIISSTFSCSCFPSDYSMLERSCRGDVLRSHVTLFPGGFRIFPVHIFLYSLHIVGGAAADRLTCTSISCDTVKSLTSPDSHTAAYERIETRRARVNRHLFIAQGMKERRRWGGRLVVSVVPFCWFWCSCVLLCFCLRKEECETILDLRRRPVLFYQK